MSGNALSIKKINRDLFWNTAGSLFYALSSMILAFFVMRAEGPSVGGIFGFGFSTFGQQMFIVAYFGIRPFHITDVKPEYSFGEYRRSRLLSCGAAILFSALFSGFMLLSGVYSAYKAFVIFLLALWKVADGMGDVYESECQRGGSLYLGGKALFFRTITSVLIFMAAQLITGSLPIAAISALLGQLTGLYCFDSRYLREGTGKPDLRVEAGKTAGIFKATVLLFLSVFLDFYIFSSVKYAIDMFLGDESSGIFNILFMPTSFVYLLANFIIKPFMTMLATAYGRGDRAGFLRICKRIKLFIGGLVLLCFAAALVLGGFVLDIAEFLLGEGYSGSLVPHRYSFAFIILGGGFYAMANFYYYILVIIRRQKGIFFVYAATALVAGAASRYAVPRFSIKGAAMCYAMLMLILMLSFLWMSRYYISREGAFSGEDG